MTQAVVKQGQRKARGGGGEGGREEGGHKQDQVVTEQGQYKGMEGGEGEAET